MYLKLDEQLAQSADKDEHVVDQNHYVPAVDQLQFVANAELLTPHVLEMIGQTLQVFS